MNQPILIILNIICIIGLIFRHQYCNKLFIVVVLILNVFNITLSSKNNDYDFHLIERFDADGTYHMSNSMVNPNDLPFNVPLILHKK